MRETSGGASPVLVRYVAHTRGPSGSPMRTQAAERLEHNLNTTWRPGTHWSRDRAMIRNAPFCAMLMIFESTVLGRARRYAALDELWACAAAYARGGHRSIAFAARIITALFGARAR